MNDAAKQVVDRITRTLLYEGFILYPYRRSVKNTQRWTFGGIYPQVYVETQQRPNVQSADNWFMQTQCLVRGADAAAVDISLQFLRLVNRKIARPQFGVQALACSPLDHSACEFVPSLEVAGKRYEAWQEAVEAEIPLGRLLLAALASKPHRHGFSFPAQSIVEPIAGEDGLTHAAIVREQRSLSGMAEVTAEPLGGGLFRLSVRIMNRTAIEPELTASRDEALLRSLISTHTVMETIGGEFLSLADPPAECREHAAACQNIGAWPVLIGERPAANVMLSSPIILEDYPQIAPESPGDLFDAAEIDEILSLRILTLTDQEKQEMCAIDDRAKALLERTQGLSAQELRRLHGTLRELRHV